MTQRDSTSAKHSLQSDRTSLKLHKPARPYEGYPLEACTDRQRWYKKIDGQKVRFGTWDDPEGALREFQQFMRQREQRLSGNAGTELHECVNLFVTAKRRLLASREISEKHLRDLEAVGKLLGQHFGRERVVSTITADEWSQLRAALLARYSPTKFNTVLTNVKSIFKWCAKSGICDEVDFGPEFKRVTPKALREHKQKQPRKIFEQGELLQLIEGSDPLLRACLLLGVNGGYNNSDIAWLPRDIDYRSGWIAYPRHKTAIDRRTPLWPQTLDALDEYLKVRPTPTDREGRKHFFLTGAGNLMSTASRSTYLTQKCSRKLASLCVNRPGLSFASCRHTFATIGSRAKDPEAIDYLMGHMNQRTISHYQAGIDNDRLIAVVQVVHQWLFVEEEQESFGIVG